jgi:hypothetical protein
VAGRVAVRRELQKRQHGSAQENDGSMQHVTPATNLGRRNRTLRLTFVSTVVSLVAVFAAVGSTIPLFKICRTEDGFTNSGISLTVVAYSAVNTLLLL